jgi:hypothetical protein
MTLPPHGFLHRSNGQQPPPTAAGVPLILGIRVLSVNFYTEFRGDLVVPQLCGGSIAAAALHHSSPRVRLWQRPSAVLSVTRRRLDARAAVILRRLPRRLDIVQLPFCGAGNAVQLRSCSGCISHSDAGCCLNQFLLRLFRELLLRRNVVMCSERMRYGWCRGM